VILFDVHAALVVSLDAALTTPVYDSFPNTNDDLREYVVVGPSFDSDDAGEVDTDWHDMPFSNRDENGICRISVVVQSGDDSATATRARCGSIVDLILAKFRDDPTLTVEANRLSPIIGRIEMKHKTGVTKDGPYVEAVLNVHYRAIHSY